FDMKHLTRPEIDLLLAISLPRGHPQTCARVRFSLAAPLDWTKLRDFASYHRVQPLLYKRLADHASELVPAKVMTELAMDFRARATRNLHLTGKLITLSKAFASAGI